MDNLINNSQKSGAQKVLMNWNSLSNGEGVSLSFADNGNGIDNDIIENIFDFGFTTTKGSGLGLYHVKNIINKIGGSISVNNKLEQGVEFILNFTKK